MNLLSFKSYSMLKESVSSFEGELNTVLNENIGAALGSPVKFTKIKNNAKKYQQALVQQAINDLDFEKKKAAGNLDKEKADVLKAANAQKNQALKDQAGAISDRMDQLATTGGLKKVVSIAKNKSKLSAAQTAAKVADGEEAKALKLKIQGLNQKIAQDEQSLKDYTDDGEKEAEGQNLDNVKTSGDKDKEKEKKADKEDKEQEPASQGAQEPAEPAEPASQGAQEPAEPAAQEPAAQGAQEPAEPAEPAAQGAQEPAEPAAQEPAAQGAQEPAAQGAQEPAEPAAQEPAAQGAQEPAAQGAQGAQGAQESLTTESFAYESIAERFRRLVESTKQ